MDYHAERDHLRPPIAGKVHEYYDSYCMTPRGHPQSMLDVVRSMIIEYNKNIQAWTEHPVSE